MIFTFITCFFFPVLKFFALGLWFCSEHLGARAAVAPSQEQEGQVEKA
jgi:hypothetical protein